jgi:hypothetical protein
MIQERKVLKKMKELIGGILEHGISMPGMYMVRLF